MLVNKKIIPMFVVLHNPIFNGVFTTKSTETKKRGRRTGESPEVISMHRIGLCSGDLPSLFNQKSFFMLHKNDDGANSTHNPAITAEQIVKTIIKHDEPLTIRENLREMMDAFFLYHEGLTPDFQDGVYSTYKVLSNALGQMDTLSRRIA